MKGDVIKISEEKVNEEIAKLHESISQFQTNIIRWMFIFWIGQFGMMLGLFFAFTR